MMYSDYYAISSCAFSVLFIPFIILSSFHFCRALEALGYQNRAYMRWLRCSFAATVVPTVLICGIAVAAQFALRLYLTNTYFNELNIIIGYAGWLLLASICIALAFARYAKTMSKAMWTVPVIADRRLAVIFVVSALVAGCTALVLNLYGWRIYIYLMPLMAPFLAPFANLFMKRVPGSVRAISSAEDWDESFAIPAEDTTGA